MSRERKFILWIEDFAGETDLLSFDFDPFSEEQIDRSNEIIATFPGQYTGNVQIIEDPTKLPKYLRDHRKEIELIVLDINFENGLSQETLARNELISELRSCRINVDPSDFEKKLGYQLFLYLLSKWSFKPDDIVIHSAYASEDTISGYRNSIIGAPIMPFFIDKRDSELTLKSYVENYFSADDNSGAWAIREAKDLLTYWKSAGEWTNTAYQLITNKRYGLTSGSTNNSTATKRCASDTNIFDVSVFFAEVEHSLNSVESSNWQLLFFDILRSVTKPFEASEYKGRIESGHEKYPWCKDIFYLMKNVRNIQAHRDYSNNLLVPSTFLFLFTVALRTLFEPLTDLSPLLPSEEILLKKFDQEIANNPIINSWSDAELLSHTEEVFIQWYFPLVKSSKLLSPVNSIICSPEVKFKYTYENVLQLLSIKSSGAQLVIKPIINSSNPRFADDIQRHKMTPSLKCTFLIDGDHRKRDSSNWSHPVVAQIAKAYTVCHLQEETTHPGSASFIL